MIEQNRDILSKAIQDMGQYSPKASGWDRITDQLDQLEAAAFAEKAGRQLPKHKAPAGSWEKIAAKLPPTALPFLSGFNGKIIAGLAIVGTAALTYLFIPFGEEDNKDETATDTKEVVTSVIPAVKEEIIAREDLAQKYGSTEDAAPKQMEAGSTPAREINPSDMYADTPGVVDEKETAPEALMRKENMTYLNAIALISLPLDKPPMTLLSPRVTDSAKQDIPEYFDASRYKLKYKTGVFYAFRHMQQFEQEGMQVPRNLSSGGLDFVIEKNRWSLKTGLEYLGWTEKGNYFFDYNQNQLIYRYNYVDSAFVSTSSGEITYFTSEREVFDSVPGLLADEASYQYRILQIALLLGYKVLDRGRFSLRVVGGFGFDIRLAGKQYIPVFDLEDASVTEVSNSLLYRTGNNWRIMAGLEAGYRFAEKWEFYLEPSYQHYMKPFYTPGNTKGKGLFELKAGLHFLF